MAKQNFVNATHVEGYVYEHKLEKKTAGPTSKNPGQEFISGTLSIATDDEMLNVIQVHFTYVTPVFAKSGKANQTYNALAAIIDGKMQSVMEHGKENASMVRIDSAIGLNEWYDSRNGNQLVSNKRNEGGFVHQVNELGSAKDRATFNVDFLITKATRKDADDERGTPEKMTLSGYAFDYSGALLPVDLSVTAPRAMDYFEGLEPSEKTPVFTRLQGQQISATVEKETVEESAFGDAKVTKVRSSYRDWVVTWAQPEPYAWDDEATLLATELKDKISERELYLANVKKRQDEYQATKGNALAGGKTAAAATAAPKAGGYDF